ncbi:ATP/GTP-binding protein [Pilimelia anulata]|uniref:ATP/GTP-binding protein n=1 Tax=Pilimelia anulata TaxID=53371 RepID=A0A8J3B4V4_9ACTN|nr:ATPase, T2SS/T4P/T4SS family [Pilimelia anulata]GGJ89788.1 ATP/GTP-binding protein [Pilimelia anulata]
MSDKPKPPWLTSPLPPPRHLAAVRTNRQMTDEPAGEQANTRVPTPRLPEPAPAAPQDAQAVDYTLVRRLHERVVREQATMLHATASDDPVAVAERERIVTRVVGVWVDEQRRQRRITPAYEDALLAAVMAEIAGLGRLQQLLDDPTIENITILGCDGVRIEYRDGRIASAPPVADSDDDLVALVANLARRAADSGSTERSLSPSQPMLDLQLKDGSRLTAIYQVSQRPVVVIRRHGALAVTLPDLVGPSFDMLDPLLADFLTAAMAARLNVLVAGWPGAGKTTLVRALAAEIPRHEWFVTMEESRELGLHTTGAHPWAVSLEAREGHGDLGMDGRPVGEITLDDMIPLSLRLNTSRVIVGEVRSREIVAMLQAMGTTGGSLATIHSRGPQMVMDRVVELVLAHRGEHSVQRAFRQVAGAVDLIVYVEMIDETAIGGRKHRFVSHVLEVDGLFPDGDGVRTTTVFGPADGQSGRAVPQHLPERHVNRLRRVGYDPGVLNQYRGVGRWPRRLDTIVGGGG